MLKNSSCNWSMSRLIFTALLGLVFLSSIAVADINDQVAQLDIDTAILDDIIDIFGEPVKYHWEGQTYGRDNLPNIYIVQYPNEFGIVMSDGHIRELRFESAAAGYLFQDLIQVGSSLDDVLSVVGQPTETVVGQPIGWQEGVLYRDIDGTTGFCYYQRLDQNVRFFFWNYVVSALYLTRSTTPPEIQLTAHYEFEGNADDSIGDNHGTMMDNAMIVDDPVRGLVLGLDADGDYVDLSRNVIVTTEFTIAAWANHSGLGGGVERSNPVFSQRDDPHGENISNVYLATESSSTSNVAHAYIRSSSGTKQSLSCQKELYNQWHHYAITVNSTDFIFYVDGLEVDRVTNNQAGDYITSIDYVEIGRHRYDQMDAGFFNGLIDDVRFYDGALDSTEIYDLYTLTAAPVCGDANHPYPIGDLDYNCRVNWSDFSIFADHWAEVGCVALTWCGGADLNQGGEVTWGDFAIFAAHWLECTAPACD